MGVGVLNLKKVAGGLAILGGSEPVAGKRGGGGSVCETWCSSVQNSNTKPAGEPHHQLGGSGGGRVTR
jgi:hypothetical protein